MNLALKTGQSEVAFQKEARDAALLGGLLFAKTQNVLFFFGEC